MTKRKTLRLRDRRETTVAPKDYQPTARETRATTNIPAAPEELAKMVMNTRIVQSKK